MPRRYAVNATLLFTLEDDDPDPEATAGAIAVVLNHTGEALKETAGIIVGDSLRIAGGKEEEARRLRSEEAPAPWVLLAGDPRGGFEVIGPFPDQETCEEHPAKWEDSDYWPIELASPAESASLRLVA
jgi:hypothetical protein